jgi:AcrR family transcriptional regulator
MSPSEPIPLEGRRRDFQDNRRRILAAAREVVAERGPEALTVSDVAHRAGINRTTAYQHFRTRDALVGAVVADLADEVTAMLVERLPIGERIDRMAHFFLQHPEVGRLVLHQMLSQNPIPQRAWDRYVGEIRNLAESDRGQDGVDSEMLGYILMCVGILWPLLARMEFDTDEAARHATARLTREVKRLLLHGLLRPERWPELDAEVRRKQEPPR